MKIWPYNCVAVSKPPRPTKPGKPTGGFLTVISPDSLQPPPSSPDRHLIRRRRSRKRQKINRFNRQSKNSSQHRALRLRRSHSLRLRRKFANFMFNGERKQATTKFSAIKIDKTRCPFLSDVTVL